jgi:Spy/CpxP family protein refolding chaperone
MSKRCPSTLTRAGLAAAAVTAVTLSVVSAVPAAASGPPAGGGGCHMVASPSATGLEHMMSGSANGNGAANMITMLSRFSPDPFCGL